jgi:hypothetical protein
VLTFVPAGLTLEARSTPTAMPPVPSSPPNRGREATTRIRDAYSNMPLRFEQSAGAGEADTEFVARGDEYVVHLVRGDAKLVVSRTSDKHRSLAMRLAGASPLASGHARNVLPGVTNHFVGNDPQKWRTGVRSYAEVEYRDVYPGVNVVYYGNQRRLEYDFIVAPGANYQAIGLAFDGSTGVSIDSTGDLVIATEAGSLVQRAPSIYQEQFGKRRQVPGGYVLRTDRRVGFWVGSYDASLPLIIDPVLTYSSYLGGAREERAAGIAVDAQGNIYVAGLTGSADFPVAGPPEIAHGSDNWDAYIVKLNASGDQFQYVTYLGGSGYEDPADIAVDGAGNVYVVGSTSSWDFPILHAIQSSRRGSNDSFVTKLDASGAIVYSTYLGGNQEEYGTGVAVDGLGRAYITGWTMSADFPTVNAVQASLGGNPAFRTTDGGTHWVGIGAGLRASYVQAFAIDPVSTSTVYAGTHSEGVFKSTDSGATWTATSPDFPAFPVNAMAVDAAHALYVANDGGLYRSRDQGASWTDLQLWTPVSSVVVDPVSGTVYAGAAAGYYRQGVFSSANGGDTWRDTGLGNGVTSLAVSQSVVYAGTPNGVFKNIGGNNWLPASGGIQEAVTSVAADPNNPDVVYAGAYSGTFYTTSGGADWSPVLGLSGAPVQQIAIAPSDPSTVYVATWYGAAMTRDGGTSWQVAGPAGTNLYFFAINPLVSTTVYGTGFVGSDVFVSRISANGSALEYSTYLGGTSSEWGSDIAVDSSGSAYIAGTTQSTEFPVLDPFQPAAGGLMDVFVAKLSEAGALTYATYLGGWGSEYNTRIAVDALGQAHVVGVTLSGNFPIANAYQPAHGGGYYDVFVTTLNQAGNGLVYSTYLGGSDWEVDPSGNFGPDVAVGLSGETFVTGTTRSINFPTHDAIQPAYGGGATDAFVANFDATGHLQYSTYLGGSGSDSGRRVAVDPTGAVVVAGATSSADFWTRHPLQAANAGAEDVFIARIAEGTPPPDTIAPTSSIALSGTPGIPGWYKSPVTVSLSAVDNEEGRGLAYIEYRLTGGVFKRYTGPFTVTQSGTTQITVRAVDRAGNVESPAPTATVAIDTSGPIVSFQVTGTFGLAGWLKSPATVTVFAVDVLGTGVESVEYRIGDAAFQGYTAPFIVSAEGVTQVTARATDRNGNVSTSTRTVSIDTAAPRTSVALQGTSGLAGWYRSPVTVSLSGFDNLPGSGVAIVEYSVNDGAFQTYASPLVVSAQGATRITARARDRAGNIETPLPPSVIQIDSSAPVVTMTSPEARDYQHSESVVVSFSAADGMSGLQSVSAALDGGAVQNSQSILLLTQTLGSHTMEVVAVDVAGNTARQSVSFRVVATIDSLIASVNIYALQGKIDASNQRSLLSKLNDAKAALDRGNTSAASAKLRDVIGQCNAQSGRGISADAAAVLAADAEYVLGRF